MKKFTFKKRLLVFVVFMFAWLGSHATLTINFSETTLTISSTTAGELETLLSKAEGQQYNQMTDEEKALVNIITRGLRDGTTLKLNGTFNTSDINSRLSTAFGNNSTNIGVHTLDLSTASFEGGLNTVDTKCKDNIIKIIFPSDATTLPVVSGFDRLEEVVLPSTLTTIPETTFQNCTSLKTVNFKDCQQLTTIGASAFTHTGLIELDLTGMPNLLTIGNNAFHSCSSLVTVKLDTTLGSTADTGLGTTVFTESKNIKDVYVNYVEGTDGHITCPKGCFDFDTTVKQTQEAGTQNATLHYPEAYYDFYVNSTNRPRFYKQTDLNGLKDDSGKAANGWQEFISSGLPFEEGSMLCTFSTQVAQRCPVHQDNNSATQDIYVYIVTGYDAENNKTTLVELDKLTDSYEENETSVNYNYYLIPANTGVIIYSKTVGLISMANATSEELTAKPHNQDASTDNRDKLNYLVPLCGNSSTRILPAEVEGTTVTYRNFSLCKFSETLKWDNSTDYWAFFRLIKCTVPANTKKAYLHFPASVYSDGDGDLADNDATWRTYSSAAKGLQLFFDDFNLNEGETTAINNVETTNNEKKSGIYTMQGIRVEKMNRPGMYIVNGKKIIKK